MRGSTLPAGGNKDHINFGERSGQMKKKNKYLSILLPPLFSAAAAAAAVLIVFADMGFYPFGTRTAAWCDMNQQVVPLLCQFKDILDGKSGMLLSMKNASGMNFWGVFFFFLASPFSLLVKFVDKSDMLIFMNILIILKMSLCAFTASLYFTVSKEHRRLCGGYSALLGFIYATSGYCMLFYQNIIWLDMMYLFPLLLLSLKRLKDKSALPYALTMALMMTVNYYIGYMTAVFLLLVGGLYVIYYRKNAECGVVCSRFVIGSAIAALISAAVWLPSFIQYLGSGRRTSLTENLRGGELITDYETIFPVMMCSAALIVFVICGLGHKCNLKPQRLRTALFVLLALPLVIEPINKMWHTGSYMSFPARYAFMTIFIALTTAASALEKSSAFHFNIISYSAALLLSAAILPIYLLTTAEYINSQTDRLTEYTRSLGGNEASFRGLGRLLVIGIICVCILYGVFKKGWLNRGVFIIFICALTFIESLGSIRIYMTSAGERSERTNDLQRKVFALSDRIDDDGFYRVKTSSKLFDYNMIGAFGYNSIGHYTSLTNEDYMFAMKQMGYTSVWMEVGTCGGTELTDALLSVGYEITNHDDGSSFFDAYGYYIRPNGITLPLGVVTKNALPSQLPTYLTRAQIQQYIFSSIFGSGELIYNYDPSEGEYQRSADGAAQRFKINEGERLIYRIDCKQKQTLYFDCFDKLTNELTEPIYDSFSVRVNGKLICDGYPYSKENGLLKLGSFENERTVIEITALKDVDCSSFGLFGLDTQLLAEKCESAQAVDFKEVKNGFEGSFNGGGTVLLSVPYDKGFTIKVNGEKVSAIPALSGFMSFELPDGGGDISISFMPSGYVLSLVLSGCGVILAVVYALLHRKNIHNNKKLSKRVSRIFAVITFTGGAAAFAAVYLLPCVLNILFYSGE